MSAIHETPVVNNPPERFMAVRQDGAVFLSAHEAHLCSSLPHGGPYILRDDVRGQAVMIRKEALRRRHKELPIVSLAPDADGWERLRLLAPGEYVVTDGQSQPRYLLIKLETSWETILLRRSACWLDGQELDAETEQDIAKRLSQLAEQMG